MTTAAAPAQRSGTARDRLLRAADELFYAEGINTVGIDRVIERAGVAKASLYSAFGGKDQLIRAYLLQRHELRKARVERHRARHVDPRDRLLAVFDSYAESCADPTYHGCPFLAATGEARTDTTVREVAAVTRGFTRDCFRADVERLGVADAEELVGQLALLYDGVVVGWQMEADLVTVSRAREMAAVMIDRAPRS
jgi:AcrR family transcriptional regulator